MDEKEFISKLIYNVVDYMYCDNCRYNDDNGNACEGCHRKYNKWAISKYVCDYLAEVILGHLGVHTDD